MKVTLRYAWIAGLLLLVASLNAKERQTRYIETSKPGEFLQQQTLEPGTLVILDLDDTTITTPEGQWLGRSELFYDLLAREQEKYPDKSKADLAAAIDTLLIPVYRKVPVIVTDDSLPSVLKELTEKGVTVIAMTSLGKGMKEVTLDQLNLVNIQFTDLGKPRWVDLDKQRQFRIEKNGVVFVSHGNKKGEALVRLLKSDALNGSRQIYLIDDRERHLQDVAQALNDFDSRIQFTPVLCTYLSNKKSYSSTEGWQQLMDFLIKHRNDSDINPLLYQEEGYTRELIKRCPSIFPDQNKCALLNREQKRVSNPDKSNMLFGEWQ